MSTPRLFPKPQIRVAAPKPELASPSPLACCSNIKHCGHISHCGHIRHCGQ